MRSEGNGVVDRSVVVAGAGPTGLMLAGELALAGVDVEIVEPRTSQELDGSRSRGLHARTIEVLDQRGIAERFLAEGQAMQVQSFAGVPLDLSDFPTRHPYGLALFQADFERILGGWVDELGVPIARGCAVTGFRQDDAGVDVELSDGNRRRTEYLVGCDGGRSLVRKVAGIAFPGLDPSTSWLIAELEMEERPEFGLRREGGGIGPAADGRRIGVVLPERLVEHSSEPTLDDVREALIAAYGTDYGAHSPTWISRFNDATRQAASYRNGRVLLAGDAAHVHPPQGGQGLNTGVQDAVNLGWKLAQVVNGMSSDALLETYHEERHPVAARVLHNARAQMALSATDERTEALRETMAELLHMDEPRKRFAGMMSGLDIAYDVGDGHPLAGRRVPDLELDTAQGPVRVFSLLHDAQAILLHLEEGADFDLERWSARVRWVEARYRGVWDLPVLGEIAAPPALLIRPDGYVAWAGPLGDPELVDALDTWFRPGT
ncbi:MAG: FAD-dependent monooxygenase [Acidimicrobiales bacterium]|nr:FAD-dependent monooxygenase [Acidimicrobiales bacterium]